MSEAVRLSSKLSKDEETNGLDALADSLVSDPAQVIVALCWFTVPKVTRDIDHGTVVPTVQMKRVEPIGVAKKAPKEIIELASRLLEQRTGNASLPFEVVEVIEGGYVNPDED